MYLLSTVWVGIEMRTACTSGIKSSASQTCTQCPPAEQLILLLLSVFSKETKTVVRARFATSRRIVHTYPTKTIALCIMHYACCAVSAVLSNSPVLSSPARSFCLKNPIREQVRHPFDSGLNFCFVFCEVGRRKKRRRMRMRKRKRSWGSSGWCSADGGSGCSAVAGVKWEVVGGVGAVEGRDGGSWEARSRCRFFFPLCVSVSREVGGWGGC